MNAAERKILLKEAEMQTNALKKINLWRMISIAFSTVGVALTYAGMAGTERNIFLGIFGIILIIVSLASAVLLNLGLRNGRRNVGKMLDILDEKGYEV